MILKSLYLKNIRSYKELILDFQEGTSLFGGDIGSGKSTILMAIEFALFGLGGIRGSSLLRVGEKEGVVKLGFSVDNEEYEVQRKLIRNKSRISQSRKDCYVKDSNGKLPLSPSELKLKILEILNFNEAPSPQAKSVIFTYAIFTPQEEMKAIITDNSERRLQTLRKAFRIEDYKIAVENASILFKNIDKKADFYDGASNGLDDDRKQLETYIEEISSQKGKIQPLLTKIEQKEKEKEEKHVGLQEIRKTVLNLTEQVGKISEIPTRIKQNENEIIRINNTIKEMRKKTDQLNIKRNNLEEQSKPTDKTLETIEEDLAQIELLEKELSRNEGALNSKILEYKHIEDEGICPTCDRPADPAEFTEKVKNKEDEKVLLLAKLHDIDINKNTYKQISTELRTYNQAQIDLKRISNEIAIIENNIKKEQIRVEEIINLVKNDKDLVKKSEKDSNLLDSLKKDVKKLEEEDRILEQNIRDSIGNLSALREGITKSEQYRDSLETTIKIKKENQVKSKTLKENVFWIRDYFIPTVSIIEKSVLANINEEFNEKFREWFGMLVEDTTKDARIDEDFSPIVEQDGYEQDLLYLSGGEKTSVALAYRLALNCLVQKVSTGMKSNLLILDEPTDGFSKEQLFKVRDILDEIRCPQVILVSHEKELESFANHVYRVEKNNGISQII